LTRALPDRSFSLALLALVAISPASATAAPVESLVSTANACVTAVGRGAVDASVLQKAGFEAQGKDAAGALRFGRSGNDAEVTLPTDRDGVNRTCVVSAPVATIEERQRLERQLTRSWARPLDQGESAIWMLRRQGVRGLQLFREGTRNAPRVRMIAAYFSEKK
jgi:hypothetical protein